jgi:hypothetical protein
MVKLCLIVACVVMLQGCIHKIVTVPVKIAYKTTKGVVKGTVAVVELAIPDGDHKAEETQQNQQD